MLVEVSSALQVELLYTVTNLGIIILTNHTWGLGYTMHSLCSAHRQGITLWYLTLKQISTVRRPQDELPSDSPPDLLLLRLLLLQMDTPMGVLPSQAHYHPRSLWRKSSAKRSESL